MNAEAVAQLSPAAKLEALRMAMADMQRSLDHMQPRDLETVVDFVACGTVALTVWDSVKNEIVYSCYA